MRIGSQMFHSRQGGHSVSEVWQGQLAETQIYLQVPNINPHKYIIDTCIQCIRFT